MLVTESVTFLQCKGLFNISSHWRDLHIVIPVSEDVREGLEGIIFEEKITSLFEHFCTL